MENQLNSAINKSIIVLDSDDESLEFVKPKRKSIGNYTMMLESLKMNDINTQASFRSYEDRLKSEINDWTTLIKTTLKATVDDKTPTIGVQDLSEDSRKYLEAAPSIQIFLSDSMKFRERAHLFLNDYQRYKNMCDQLIEVSDAVVENSKMQLMHQRMSHAFFKK